MSSFEEKKRRIDRVQEIFDLRSCHLLPVEKKRFDFAKFKLELRSKHPNYRRPMFQLPNRPMELEIMDLRGVKMKDASSEFWGWDIFPYHDQDDALMDTEYVVQLFDQMLLEVNAKFIATRYSPSLKEMYDFFEEYKSEFEFDRKTKQVIEVMRWYHLILAASVYYHRVKVRLGTRRDPPCLDQICYHLILNSNYGYDREYFKQGTHGYNMSECHGLIKYYTCRGILHFASFKFSLMSLRVLMRQQYNRECEDWDKLRLMELPEELLRLVFSFVVGDANLVMMGSNSTLMGNIKL